jgi:hypothetical protein
MECVRLTAVKALLLVTALVLGAPACGGVDDRETTVAEGNVAIEVAPLRSVQRGINTFSLSIHAADVMVMPSADANVEVTAWMPAMGHGAPTDPRVVTADDGSYRIDDVVFSMPGTWELRVRVTCAQGWGSQTFRYEVE